MLVTNSVKNDMNNVNQYISGMALCALGNIGNQEMCLALSREVQNQMSVENPLIRKKAALCAMRIIKKVEDIEDKFNNRLTTLLEDKNHGVVLSACSLLVHLLETNASEHM
ncbi:adenosine tri phosphatase, partial [Perkinsus sp. BL_2016]